MHDIPSNLKFSKTHVRLEDLGEISYRVGITDFAQDELGDIGFVEPPEEGREYEQADECAVVDSVPSEYSTIPSESGANILILLPGIYLL